MGANIESPAGRGGGGGRPLSELPVGTIAEVRALLGGGMTHMRLLDLGIVPGTRLQVVRRSPLGDPTAFLVRGALIALRRQDAATILVVPVVGSQPSG